MRTLGLIGGMSWESTAIYYRHLNELARERLGGLHSARLLLWSFDFAEVAKLQHAGDWAGCADLLADAASRLERGWCRGAGPLHQHHAQAGRRDAGGRAIPLLHIADATAAAIMRSESRRPALLATRFTMEQQFYKGRLRDRHGLEAIVPAEAGRELVHQIIYEELCLGVVRDESKAACMREIDRLRQDGADGIILGCTELTMLISQDDLDLPVFDTTRIHAEAAMEFATACLP